MPACFDCCLRNLTVAGADFACTGYLKYTLIRLGYNAYPVNFL